MQKRQIGNFRKSFTLKPEDIQEIRQASRSPQIKNDKK